MTEPGTVSLKHHNVAICYHIVNQVNLRAHLEQSQRQVVQLLLLTESDEELLAELGVEKDLFFFELQFWFPSLGPYRGAEGSDVVTDVVNTGFLNITCCVTVCQSQNISSKYYLQGYRVVKEVISLIIHDVSRLDTSLVRIYKVRRDPTAFVLKEKNR